MSNGSNGNNDIAIDGSDRAQIQVAVPVEFLARLREVFPAALSDSESLRMAAGAGLFGRERGRDDSKTDGGPGAEE